jgi:glycosyltransferase involved in cell wall biosynthesis
MNPPKIVIARIFCIYDGRVSSRAGVITRLNREKFETICIYLTKSSSNENYFETLGYKVFYLSDKKVKDLSLGNIWKLSKILKANKVDIVHCHRHRATAIGTLAAMVAKVPVVISHVHGVRRTRNLRRKLFNYFLFRHASKILTVGEAVRKDVLKCNFSLPESKVVSEGNSVDYESFVKTTISKEQAKAALSLPTDAFVYGTVGRLVPTKGQTYLIKAFARVKVAVPTAHLIFVGEGRLLNELRDEAAKAGLSNSVHFLGRRDDMPNVFRAMDVFVLSSVAEGMSRALLEAMAAGVPSIASNAGAISEIIDDGRSGVLVPRKDEISLAGAMIKLAGYSQSQREKMIVAAKEKFYASFTQEIVARRLEEIYEDQISQSKSKISV